MSFVVPFDGSSLAEAALARAVELGRALDEEVIAVTVIPQRNAKYARAKGWLDDHVDFDREAVVAAIQAQIRSIAPEVTHETLAVDRYAPPGTIANHLRRFVRNRDATMVFLGSENAGRLVTSISSIGGRIASGTEYDVVIVRRRAPSRIDAAAANSPYHDPAADIAEADPEDEAAGDTSHAGSDH
jgi:nucleotide-binding universal stress UspA family protein